MNFHIYTQNNQITEFFEKQLINSLESNNSNSVEKITQLNELKTIHTETKLGNILILNEINTEIKSFLISSEVLTIVILTQFSNNLVLKPNVYYAVFNLKKRFELVQKGLKDVFFIPIIIDDSNQFNSFKEFFLTLKDPLKSYFEEGLDFYLNKDYSYYKKEFTSNSQYRQILKIINIFEEKTRIPNANFDYKINQ